MVPELPSGQTFRPSRGARIFVKEARSLVLVMTADGLAVREDGVHEIRWDSVAGVMRTPDPTVVFGLNGCAIPVSPDIFRGAGEVLDVLTRRVDESLWFNLFAYSAAPDD